MSVHRVIEASVAVVAPAGAPAVDAYALTGDRVVATTAALLALVSVAAGVLAVTRRRGRARRWSAAAVGAGVVSCAIGWLVLATADGGPGTGNGVVGGGAAAVLGLVGAGLGGAALARARTLAG